MEAQEALSEFVEGLKEAYSERQFITEEQWPPVRGDKLINLQLVEAEKEEGFRAGLPQHGIPDDMVKRTPIIHGNLFHVEKGKKLVRKLIVEGNAGIGKTTLCTMLAEGWAGGNILTQYECVLLLPLRDPLVSSASSLTGLLALHHPDEIICEPVVRHLKRTRGKEMLIIADGWDELSETNRSKVSFLYNLLFGRLLPSASVLLTSRPSASAPLHDLPSVDRLVEVVGFNEENIKQYIESEFDQFPEKASSLIEQLNNNPVIESVCSVPLNCAIVCNLWHTLDQELPRTLTGLYTQIVLNIILRNIKKKFPDCPIGLNGFDDIPNDLQDTFWLICEFAYECLLLDQLVFSETELSSRLPESGDKLHCFGLLQSARSLLAVGHGLSFHFAHSTIQEFLAALHLATLPNKEKLKVVEAHDDSDRFDIVWRFMFGLASKYHDSCSNQVIGLDDDLMDKYMAFKYGDLASVCHAAFEASDQSLAKKICNVFGKNLLYGDFKTPFDCVARFYVLRYALKCDNMVIRISFCAIGDKLLKELTDILSNANGNLQVRDLLLAQTKLSDKGVADLFKRASAAFIALDELSLISNNFTDIMSSFVSCTSLTQLYLSENPLGVFGIQSLEIAVRAGVLVRLATLHLSNTLTGDADVNGALLTTLFQSIASHCANLEILSLSDNNLGLPGLCSVVENIPLRLNHIDLKSTHLTNSFHSVSQYTVTSEILNLYPKNLYCLRSMDLTGSNFSGSAGTLLLEKSLQALQSLEELNCSDCSITSVDIAMLIHLLKSANVKCKNLKWWNLGDNNIDDEGVIALTRCLPELFIRLEGFSTSVVYGLTNAVFLIGNPVGEELILMCNEHLKVFEESQKIAMLNEWERTYLPPQNEMTTHVFCQLWDTLLLKMIDMAGAISPAFSGDDDSIFLWQSTDDALNSPNDAANNIQKTFVDNRNSPQATERSSNDDLICPAVMVQITEREEADSIVSVSDSSCDERVTPPLPTSPAKTVQASSEFTLSLLDKELKTLTKPIQFGVSLGIPQHRLEVIQQDNRFDTEGQKIALFQFITKNYKSLGITWSVIADALRDIDYRDLSTVVREKYCT